MAYKKSPPISCPFCDLSSKHEKKIDLHLRAEHSTTLESAFVQIKLNGTPFTCLCGCGEPTTFNGWRLGYTNFVKGHNTRVDSVFSHQDVIKKCVKSRADSFAQGKYTSWNAGLTKETSEKVAEMSEKISESLQKYYDSPDTTSWQTGLTKETDDRIRQASETKKSLFSSGQLSSWNEGLTKKTDKRLALIGSKISKQYKKREAGARLSPGAVKIRVEKANFTLLEDNYQTRRTILCVMCNVCGTKQNKTLYSLLGIFACSHCRPRESKALIEIFEFVESLGASARLSDRKLISPKEVDVIIPDKNLAIEFNGLFWHSEKYTPKNYHADKTTMCEQVGYQLIHIFGDEWKNKQDIVKSMLSHRLGCTKRRVGARQCDIRSVNSFDRKAFFNENHIDGDTAAFHAIGLYRGNELLVCLSLRRPFHKKWQDRLEIGRFAQKRHTSVSGALSRLLSAAKKIARDKKKKGLLSYVDTRYGDGHGYLAAGFEQVSKTNGTFWWTDSYQRFNRFKFRADRARGMTERQVAQEAGVTKIYGCPQLVMTIDV